MVKSFSCAKSKNVELLCIIIEKINWFIEESNGKKYLTLVPTDENKDILTKYEELWKKIKYLLRSVTNNLHDYDEKYMKIRFNSDNYLPLKKTLELYNIATVVRSVFPLRQKILTTSFFR